MRTTRNAVVAVGAAALLAGTLVVAAPTTQARTRTAASAPTGYPVALHRADLSGTSLKPTQYQVLDNTTLSIDQGRIRGYNVKVHDNQVDLIGNRGDGGDRPYSSAYFWSRGLVSFPPPTGSNGYRIQATLRMPQASAGTWPAFWLRPDDGTDGDELDVMEQVGGHTPFMTVATAHRSYTTNPKQVSRAVSLGFDPQQWHTYAVEWDPSEIRWYVDSRLIYTINPANTPWFGEVFQRRMGWHLRFNLQMGGEMPSYWGPQIGTASKLPAVYSIKNIGWYAKQRVS
ncbi:glycoside hydrolase family 16 protein [Jatrophihabitans sp. YIM 134969]